MDLEFSYVTRRVTFGPNAKMTSFSKIICNGHIIDMYTVYDVLGMYFKVVILT